MATSGRILSSKMLLFLLSSSIVSTAKEVTSLPVPAVVGTQISGAGLLGTSLGFMMLRIYPLALSAAQQPPSPDPCCFRRRRQLRRPLVLILQSQPLSALRYPAGSRVHHHIGRLLLFASERLCRSLSRISVRLSPLSVITITIFRSQFLLQSNRSGQSIRSRTQFLSVNKKQIHSA